MDFRKLAQAGQLFASRIKRAPKEESKDMFRLLADRLSPYAKRDPKGEVSFDIPEGELKGPEMWALARYYELDPSQQRRVLNRIKTFNHDVAPRVADLTDNLGLEGTSSIDPETLM